MTKNELISLVWKSVGKSRYHEKAVELTIGRAYQQLMKEAPRSKSIDLSEFCKTEKVSVTHNTIFSYYYFTLPFSVAQIPGPGKGIVRIKTLANVTGDIIFVPVAINRSDTHEMSQYPDDSIGYWVEGNICKFDNNFNSDYEELVITAIPSFESYEYTDEVYIPAGRDAFLLQIVRELLSGKPPEKETNDNSQKTL